MDQKLIEISKWYHGAAIGNGEMNLSLAFKVPEHASTARKEQNAQFAKRPEWKRTPDVFVF